MSTHLKDTEMSVRTVNCLLCNDIETLEEAAIIPDDQLLKIPNLGRKSLMELKDELQKRGIIRRIQLDTVLKPAAKPKMIHELHISDTTMGRLARNQLYYISRITSLTKKELLMLPNIGRKDYAQITDALNELNLELADEDKKTTKEKRFERDMQIFMDLLFDHSLSQIAEKHKLSKLGVVSRLKIILRRCMYTLDGFVNYEDYWQHLTPNVYSIRNNKDKWLEAVDLIIARGITQ